ncbi:MAG: DsbA family protein [Thermoplasmata archaeon]
MTETIHIYFDFVCPYSYIASKRAGILKRDFDVQFNWKPWEIYPERPYECETRGDLTCSMIVAMLAREIGLAITMPRHMSNSHVALLGAEFAKKKGKFNDYRHAVFQAHWEEKKDISDIEVLKAICSKIGMDPDEFEQEIANPEYDKILEENDREAERMNVQQVPSYILEDRIVVGNVRLADLKKEIKKFLRA